MGPIEHRIEKKELTKESEKSVQRSKEYQQGIVSQMLRECFRKELPNNTKKEKKGREKGRKER